MQLYYLKTVLIYLLMTEGMHKETHISSNTCSMRLSTEKSQGMALFWELWGWWEAVSAGQTQHAYTPKHQHDPQTDP